MNNIRAIRSAVLSLRGVWPEGVNTMYVYSEELEAADVSDDYEGETYWSSPMYLGRNWCSEMVTESAVKAFIRDNPRYTEDFGANSRKAMETLAQLSKDLSKSLTEGLELAQEFGLDFDIDLGSNGELQVTKAADVDWDSSSMYC